MPKVDNRGKSEGSRSNNNIYGKYVDTILINYFKSIDEDKMPLYTTTNQLARKVGIINGNYSAAFNDKEKFFQYTINDMGETANKTAMWNVFGIMKSSIKSILKSSLDRLSRMKFITYEDTYMLVHKKLVRAAIPNECKIIDEIEKEVLIGMQIIKKNQLQYNDKLRKEYYEKIQELVIQKIECVDALYVGYIIYIYQDNLNKKTSEVEEKNALNSIFMLKTKEKLNKIKSKCEEYEYIGKPNTFWSGYKDTLDSSYIPICDEDIMKTLLQINKVSIKDLLKILSSKNIPYLDIDEVIKKFKNIILNVGYKAVIETKPISLENMKIFENTATDIDKNISSNAIGFLSSRVAYRFNADKDIMQSGDFYRESDIINYLVKHDLPEQKIIILSATANEKVYKQMFGDRVIFHYCKKAEYKGNLIQYPAKGYSRYGINNDEKLMKTAKNIVGGTPIITFKSNKENESDLSFGNTEGHNSFEGQDIAVVGTPHLNEIVYKMYAIALGIDISNENMKYQEIGQNNFKYWFMTYDNEDLRNIQTWLIESELEQAVGRARLLRNNCSVFLFSNYPLEQAEFKYIDKE